MLKRQLGSIYLDGETANLEGLIASFIVKDQLTSMVSRSKRSVTMQNRAVPTKAAIFMPSEQINLETMSLGNSSVGIESMGMRFMV